MSLIRVIAINVTLLIALLGSVLVIPPLAWEIFSAFPQANTFSPKDIVVRDLGRFYGNPSLATQSFKELRMIKPSYYDYVTWRSQDFSGEAIEVDLGQRKTIWPDAPSSESWAVFGGSTVWGVGSYDSITLPSMLARHLNARVYNYGQQAYMARQSLAELQNYYISSQNRKRRTNLFYDGVNEVLNRCQTNSSLLGTPMEPVIRARMDLTKYGLDQTFYQFSLILKRVSSWFKSPTSEPLYDCHLRPKKARFVAKSLINTWLAADRLSKEHGDRFLAVLQPVAYVESSNAPYLRTLTADKHTALQFEVVYRNILSLIQKVDVPYLDLHKLFDSCSNCYIDFCHLGEFGNELVARAIAESNYAQKSHNIYYVK